MFACLLVCLFVLSLPSIPPPKHRAHCHTDGLSGAADLFLVGGELSVISSMGRRVGLLCLSLLCAGDLAPCSRRSPYRSLRFLRSRARSHQLAASHLVYQAMSDGGSWTFCLRGGAYRDASTPARDSRTHVNPTHCSRPVFDSLVFQPIVAFDPDANVTAGIPIVYYPSSGFGGAEFSPSPFTIGVGGNIVRTMKVACMKERRIGNGVLSPPWLFPLPFHAVAPPSLTGQRAVWIQVQHHRL